jgi:hypothetical protein
MKGSLGQWPFPTRRSSSTWSLRRHNQKTLDLSHLTRHVGSDEFIYAQRTIKTKYCAGGRSSLTRVNETLFGTPHMLDKANLTTVAIEPPDILELEVPNSPMVDMSAFSFGISTKIPRLHNAITQIAHCNQPISMSYIPSSELLTSLVGKMFHAPCSLLTLSSLKKYIAALMVGLPNSGCQLHAMAPSTRR